MNPSDISRVINGLKDGSQTTLATLEPPFGGGGGKQCLINQTLGTCVTRPLFTTRRQRGLDTHSLVSSKQRETHQENRTPKSKPGWQHKREGTSRKGLLAAGVAYLGGKVYTMSDRLGSVVSGVWARSAPSDYGTNHPAQPPSKSRHYFGLQVADLVGIRSVMQYLAVKYSIRIQNVAAPRQ